MDMFNSATLSHRSSIDSTSSQLRSCVSNRNSVTPPRHRTACDCECLDDMDLRSASESRQQTRSRDSSTSYSHSPYDWSFFVSHPTTPPTIQSLTELISETLDRVPSNPSITPNSSSRTASRSPINCAPLTTPTSRSGLDQDSAASSSSEEGTPAASSKRKSGKGKWDKTRACLPRKFKTMLCKYYVSNNECPYGPKCAYAHGMNEVREALPSTATS